MELYEIASRPALTEPVMIMALTGWVDAAGVGTDAAAHIAGDAAELVARFGTDELFDYRDNRPMLTFTDGELADVSWPRLEMAHTSLDGTDLLILSGNEPDFRWKELSKQVVDLAQSLGISRVMTLAAVPAAVPHTRPPPIITRASDPELLGDDDSILTATMIVPGAALSILSEAVADSGIPVVGYWAQVPHYLGSPYHAGVLALVQRASAHLGVAIPLGSLMEDASEQGAELDQIVAARPEAKAYLERLEGSFVDGSIPSADEIGAEVERFLAEASGDEDNPFR